MNTQRITAGFLVAFAVAFFASSALDTLNDPVFSIDFLPYHLAGQLLARGELEPLTNYAQTGGFFANSGPFLTAFHDHFFPSSDYALRWVYYPAYLWIFLPLAQVDFPTAARIWLGVNTLLCIGSVLLIWSARQRTRSASASPVWQFAWVLFLGLTFQPVFSNLMHGQVTGLIFFFFCMGYWLLRRGYPFGAGLAFGAIVPLKFYPALLIIYFLFRRRWQVVFGAAAAGIILVLISLATVGLDANIAYARLIAAELGKGGIAAFNNESLTGFLLHAFTSGDVNTWQEMAMPQWLSRIRLGIILSTLAAFVWVMRKGKTNGEDDSTLENLDLSLVLLFMLLASPICWYHYYMWLIFPLVVAFEHLLKRPWLPVGYLIALAVAYGLMVVEGVYEIRPFNAQALQTIRILRIMLSQSFFGAVILAGLIFMLRKNYGENPGQTNARNDNAGR